MSAKERYITYNTVFDSIGNVVNLYGNIWDVNSTSWEFVSKKAKEIAEEEIVHVDAVHADEILTDAEAEEMIEVVEKASVYKTQVDGKLCEINLDTLCENFADGDVVTIDSLKEKKLISQNAGRVKVLARGVMTKKLTVYADKFSIQAVKMIALAGGHVDMLQ